MSIPTFIPTMKFKQDPKFLPPDRDPYKPVIIFKWNIPRRNSNTPKGKP